MKRSSFFDMPRTSFRFPVTKTVSHAMTRTTAVRSIVPRLDSTPEMPTLPRIEVSAANTADNTAYKSQSFPPPAPSSCGSPRFSIMRYVPTAIIGTAIAPRGEIGSPSRRKARRIESTVEDLSIGTTLSTLPSCNARKYESHDAPVANPERTRKHHVPTEMLPISEKEPTISTMRQDITRTTPVRMAVATVESVLLMPHFARMEVSPANSAEPNANKIHIPFAFFAFRRRKDERSSDSSEIFSRRGKKWRRLPRDGGYRQYDSTTDVFCQRDRKKKTKEQGNILPFPRRALFRRFYGKKECNILPPTENGRKQRS